MTKAIKSELAVFLASLLLFILIFWFLIPASNAQLKKSDFLKEKQEEFHLLAIGDSLTQGVGDTTNQGGFVPLLAKRLDETYRYHTVASNYGISGNTSRQILNRMKKQKAIQKNLKTANLMTLTVGGNDVMKVIRENLDHLKSDNFKAGSKAYKSNLRQIIDLARKENPDLPIYIIGIYNPFYLNFPEMTQMQDIVDNWNLGTENLTTEYDKVYFVGINDQLYKGIDGQEGVVSVSGDQTTVVNDALFTEDHFHPNNTGYSIMADAIMERISQTHENK
ncbi:SGNH/GDSL hydrolase family protein [Streptococcus thoraltensis]|uniref:SGNH/GDSL hydrolase family protein n=1 Tax=Streptococcus thoraltensis TaxID=55085 RepID=UPI0003612BF5|nr:SGNH/GDSL hydrolase family protein [Streptococcus thoraltensis]MDY4761973.1 SGNH/GDSL hydrolase family protein [Streptococcus thoraltensis]